MTSNDVTLEIVAVSMKLCTRKCVVCFSVFGMFCVRISLFLLLFKCLRRNPLSSLGYLIFINLYLCYGVFKVINIEMYQETCIH